MSDQLTNAGTGQPAITADTKPVDAGTTNAVTPTGSTLPSDDWMTKLPEDLREAPSVKNFKGKDVTEIVKSYVSAQEMLGRSIRIPGPDASAEVKADFIKKLESVPGVARLPDPADKAATDAFYEKLGTPKSPDGYKINIPKEIEPAVDPAVVNNFKQLAHNLKLNQSQTEGLVNYELQRVQQQMQALAVQRQAVESSLKTEWGNDFDNRLALALEAKNHFASKYPDAVNELVRSSAGNNPVVIMAMAELGRMYREAGVIKGERPATGGLTPEEARARIAEIRSNRDHPFHSKRNDMAHRQAVEEMNRLYDAANPKNGQSDIVL